jgi:heparin binding hemagglutinin HbhA
LSKLSTLPHVVWREELPRQELDEGEQLMIERDLGMRLFGYGKPAESIIGHRVLHEKDGYADLLLMRRNFGGRGYFFDLDVTLREVGGQESERLRKVVRRTIRELMSQRGQQVTVHANPTIDDLKPPLLAALGAADLALATVNGLLAELRERAEETRSDTRSRVEERRAGLGKLKEDLPEQLRELRERFTSEELRSAAEGYVEAATSRYNELVERGEAALERLRSQSGVEDASARAEGYVDQAVELTQEALDTVASQTRAVGERAAKLVGIELPKKAPVKKAPAKKAPAKKAAAKKTPAKKTPAKKAPAKFAGQTPKRRG